MRVPQPLVRSLAFAHAGTRTAIGLSLLLVPSRTARPWLGHGVEAGGGRVALHAFAVRDAAIGLAILRGLLRREPVRHWFRLGLGLELVDSGATVRYRRQLPEGREPDAWALLGAAGLVGGAVIALLLEE